MRSSTSSKNALLVHQQSMDTTGSSRSSSPTDEAIAALDHENEGPHYESPIDLKADYMRESQRISNGRKKQNLIYEPTVSKKINGRKKRNLIYEPSIPLRPAENGRSKLVEEYEEDKIYYPRQRSHCSKFQVFFIVMAFLIALTALAMSTLTTLGILIPPKCACGNSGK